MHGEVLHQQKWETGVAIVSATFAAFL